MAARTKRQRANRCSGCGAELRLGPDRCPLCGCEQKRVSVAPQASDLDTYHDTLRRLRRELKSLRDDGAEAV